MQKLARRYAQINGLPASFKWLYVAINTLVVTPFFLFVQHAPDWLLGEVFARGLDVILANFGLTFIG